MGFIENFKKLGYRFTSTQQKPKMTKREFLREIHSVICSVDTGEPVAVWQKFEKINVAQYTDTQVNAIYNSVIAIFKQYK
jgi:hypothetical protein